MGKQDLTVIILSFNTKSITKKCLQKLRISKKYCEKELGNKVKVVVVEQGSKDGSKEMIKKKYPWVELLEPERNLGFGGGNNLAMSIVDTPYILLINSDVYLKENTLSKALNIMGKRKDIDVLQVGIRYGNGSFQPCGGNLPGRINTIIRFFELDRLPLIKTIIKPIPVTDESYYRKERELGWSSGVFMLLKKAVFEKTGGFDGNIFMFGEDIEWCKRIHDEGFKIVYTPQIVVTHLCGASMKGREMEAYKMHLEGYLYYHRKHYLSTAILIKLAIKISLALKGTLYLFLTKKRADYYFGILKTI